MIGTRRGALTFVRTCNPSPCTTTIRTNGRWWLPIINCQEREIERTMRVGNRMVQGHDELPADMRRFIETPVAKGFRTGFLTGAVSGGVLALLLIGVLRFIGASLGWSLILGASVLALNTTVLYLRFRSHATTPLAVNINHPFMGDDPLGAATVLVRLSNGDWVDPGPHRVRTVNDELMGGLALVQDTDEYPSVGHFSERSEKTPLVARHLALINQAIALRDAVNDVPDPIEQAREREASETGLLDRSWLEGEQVIDVESPVVAFFRGKE